MISLISYPFQVNHSQRVSESPLVPWIAIRKSGAIETAHCNCKAGLSTVCSHVGAALFAVEAIIRLEDKITSTSRPCTFILPKPMKNVPFNELSEIIFSCSVSKKRTIDEAIERIPQEETDEENVQVDEFLHESNDRVPKLVKMYSRLQ